METRLDTILNNKSCDLHTVEPDATVIDAVRLMNQERVGAVLVLQDSKLVGVFTERDVLTRVMEPARDPRATKITEVMTERVVTVPLSTTLEEAQAVMTQKRCRHLPVLENGELVGLVSIGDLTCWTVHDKNYLIDQLVNYVTRQYPV
jgi:CBS domain-containing protein